jgi:hypothetical protein
MKEPFRWNIAYREQLGRLISDDPTPVDPGLIDTLQACAARVLALARNSDVLFIGRSPENLFDYLSGILAPTSWADRCSLVNLSLRDLAQSTPEPAHAQALALGKEILTAYELSPE